ncbi:cytidine deaminase-like protein [Gorgonomyces haynaldii]|nr:cytidine deaminase-like protein [Gorgonomyces haynaldii]
MTDAVQFMRAALEQAEEALACGEVPVGCVLVHKGEIVARGRNNTNASLNATRHAEFEAIDSLFRNKGVSVEQMKEIDLYVTVEPCIMCGSALGILNVRKVYFGCHNEHFGGNGSIMSIHEGDGGFHRYPVESGILANEAILLLRKFYITENDNAPQPRKKANRTLKVPL